MTLSVRPRWLATVSLAGVILVVSVVPVPEAVPEEGGGIPTSAVFHFVGYAALSALIGFALLVRRSPVYGSGAGVASASAYGALIECLQSPIPYRSFGVLDMAINAAGAVIGGLVLLGALALSEHHR